MVHRRHRNAEAEWRAETARRTRELEATATDIERLTVADSGVHHQLDAILRGQSDFAKQVLGIFRAYDEEMRERDQTITRLEERVRLLLWVDGVTFVAVLGALVTLAFRGLQ